MKKLKLLILFVLPMAACQPKTVKEKPTPVTPLFMTSGMTVISAESENVRLSPNGKAVGQLLKGDTLQIIKRHANWLFFESDFFESGYIWAPSAGLEYINLHNPYTYYDSTASEFYPLEYFHILFGSEGENRSNLVGETEIIFDEIGLGSHNEIVMEVADEQVETIKHGIILYLQEPENRIFKIKIDFFRPVEGLEKAIERCGLSYLPFSEENGGHVIWKSGALMEGLEVDLERKEWESNWFSVLWLRKSKEEAGN
jgi:hypothetical protein